MNADFEIFWRLGPWLRLGKKAAARHFKATVKTEQDWEDIQAARIVYDAHLKLHPWKHPQHGSTWFNQWRDWTDTLNEPYPLVFYPGYEIEGSKRGAPLTEREQEGARELIALQQSRCRLCGASGADSSGRCFDCVNREFNRVAMEQRDKRSLWKIRDIEDGN